MLYFKILVQTIFPLATTSDDKNEIYSFIVHYIMPIDKIH